MRISTALLTFTGLVSHLTTAAYTLQDDYSPNSFFSMFDFFTADDPTHGYVNYIDQGSATSAGLAGTKNGQIYMGVDTTSVASGRGRNSVRITSKKSYNAGSLIILDLDHMPGSICGTWPAFWTVGPNWPNNGEIDIIEGVNTQASNHYALHTSSGCSISNTGTFSGNIDTPNCDVNAAGQPNNAGCGILTSDTSSYGDGFNAQQGGIYATEFSSSAISIYFFPRSAIPTDITSGTPDPSGWGKPHASFGSPCNIGKFVKQQQIVFDTTFCGDWAGNVWSTDATCSSKASTCQDFVRNNPSAFKESYWSINSLRVYSGSGSGGAPSGPPGSVSQKPTISGGVPTGQPSVPGIPGQSGQPPFPGAPGGAPQSQSWGSGAPAPAPSALPQGQGQQSWGGNENTWRGKFTVSGWDGGQWNQAANTNAAPASTPAATAGQFYDASAVNGAVVVGATGLSGGDAGVAGTGVNNAAAAATGAGAGVNTGIKTENGVTANTNVIQGENVDGDTGADADTDPDSSSNTNTNANTNNAAPPQGQYQDIRTGIPSTPPSVTAPPQASKTCGLPWIRSSWSGRYLTVTAMGNGEFGSVKRAVNAEGLMDRYVEMGEEISRREEMDEEVLSRREETEDEGLRKREDGILTKRKEEEQDEVLRRREEKQKRGEHEHEHLHFHRHLAGGGMGRKRGWWRS